MAEKVSGEARGGQKRERERKKTLRGPMVGTGRGVRSCPRRKKRVEKQSAQTTEERGATNKLPGRSQRQVKQRRRG